MTKEDIEYFANGDESIKKDIEYLVEVFTDAKEYGSILEVKEIDFEKIENRLSDIKVDVADLFTKDNRYRILNIVPNIVNQTKLIANKYYICVTNPPYIGSKGINDKLKSFIEKYYNDVKSDLYSVFIYRCYKYSKVRGQIGLMTPYTWMFISSYEKLRENIIRDKSITSLIQLEYSGFEEATVPICTFTLRNYKLDVPGCFIKLSEFKGAENQPKKVLEAIENPGVNYRFYTDTTHFKHIPGTPIAYWVNKSIWEKYNKLNKVKDYSDYSGAQNKTANNDKYLRNCWEVEKKK